MAIDQIMKIGQKKLKQYNKQSQCPFNTVSQSGRNKSDYGGKDLWKSFKSGMKGRGSDKWWQRRW